MALGGLIATEGVRAGLAAKQSPMHTPHRRMTAERIQVAARSPVERMLTISHTHTHDA